MAEMKTVLIIPLYGKNYLMWKEQCRMMLVKDGVWNIVNDPEVDPGEGAEGCNKFMSKTKKREPETKDGKHLQLGVREGTIQFKGKSILKLFQMMILVTT